MPNPPYDVCGQNMCNEVMVQSKITIQIIKIEYFQKLLEANSKQSKIFTRAIIVFRKISNIFI